MFHRTSVFTTNSTWSKTYVLDAMSISILLLRCASPLLWSSCCIRLLLYDVLITDFTWSGKYTFKSIYLWSNSYGYKYPLNNLYKWWQPRVRNSKKQQPLRGEPCRSNLVYDYLGSIYYFKGSMYNFFIYFFLRINMIVYFNIM